MKLFMKLLLLFTLLAVLFTVSNWNKKQVKIIRPPETTYVSGESRANDEGNVRVTVTPANVSVGEQPRFTIEFNTHTVELDFEITKITKLIDDKGNTYTNTFWQGSPPGGHHISGDLIFKDRLKETKYIELIIEDVSNIPERRFKWEL